MPKKRYYDGYEKKLRNNCSALNTIEPAKNQVGSEPVQRFF
jgi:hypothetical protein